MKNEKQTKPKVSENDKNQILERLDRITVILEDLVNELTETRKRKFPTSEELFGKETRV